MSAFSNISSIGTGSFGPAFLSTKYSTGQLLKSIILISIFYLICRAIYRLWFHPLAKFPGPKTHAVSHIPYLIAILKGRPHSYYRHLHEKYGPVVRSAPNTLSFATPKAYDETHLFGHAQKRKQFLKNDFYDGLAIGANLGRPKHLPPLRNMVTERDPEKHAALRKLFAGGFSKSALMKQEQAVQSIADTFIQRLAKAAETDEILDIRQWFIRFTFDVASELSFGESLGSLKTEKSHFWITAFTKHFYLSILFEVARRYPILMKLIKTYLEIPNNPGTAVSMQMKNYTRQQVERRIENDKTRVIHDFLSPVIQNGEVMIDPDQLRATASLFVVAGSETTAHAFTVATWYLLKNPRVHQKLKQIVREKFNSENEIDLHTSEIPYVCAVIDEALRISPPIPLGGFRDSPGEYVEGHFIPKGTEVCMAPFALSHSENYFKNPNEFLPERWLEGSGDNFAASKPWSWGPRICLGRYLALFELRLVLCRIMYRFDMELDESTEDDWPEKCQSFVTWRDLPVNIRVKAREAGNI